MSRMSNRLARCTTSWRCRVMRIVLCRKWTGRFPSCMFRARNGSNARRRNCRSGSTFWIRWPTFRFRSIRTTRSPVRTTADGESRKRGSFWMPPKDGYIEFGHHAKTRKQFTEWSESGKWDALLRYLHTPVDGFIDIPAGTLHAIGKGVLTYNISRNADCTLRLYDYDRVDPATGRKRPIQVEEVLKNVNVPDRLIEFQMYPVAIEHGCLVTRYWDEPGLYTLIRIQTKDGGRFLHDGFAFYTCVKGEGTINGVPIRQGETVLVPCHMGWITLEGNMDLFLAGYRNENGDF